jgi:hypothetical protein
VGDDGHGEAVGQGLDHREAHAVDGDGALLDDVAEQRRRGQTSPPLRDQQRP